MTKRAQLRARRGATTRRQTQIHVLPPLTEEEQTAALPDLSAEQQAAIADATDEDQRRELLGKYKTQVAVRRVLALNSQVAARRQLIITAEALLPKATKLAEKGKPRLLAVVSKIILDRHLRFTVPE